MNHGLIIAYHTITLCNNSVTTCHTVSVPVPIAWLGRKLMDDRWQLVGRTTIVYHALMRLQLNYILNKDNYSLKLSWVYGTMLLSSINFLSLHTCYVWDGHKIVFISVNLVHKLICLWELHIELYSVTSCTARAIWKDIKSSLGLTILRLIWSHFSVWVDSLLGEFWHRPYLFISQINGSIQF